MKEGTASRCLPGQSPRAFPHRSPPAAANLAHFYRVNISPSFQRPGPRETDSHLQPPLPSRSSLPPSAVTGAAALAAGERWGAACHSRALRSPRPARRSPALTHRPLPPSAGPSRSPGGGALPADPAPPSPPALVFSHRCYYFIFSPLPFGPVRQLGEPRRCPAAWICRVGGHRGVSRRAHLRQLLLEICFPCYF